MKESVWRTYKNIVLLGKDNQLRVTDMGLIHSSAADTMVTLVLNRLRQDGDVEKDVSPNFLVRNWPGMKEWSTKSVRDAFFASPKFPRLLNPEGVRETIARGVESSIFAYVGKTGSGTYEPFFYGGGILAGGVELSDDVYIIPRETAEQYKKAKDAAVSGQAGGQGTFELTPPTGSKTPEKPEEEKGGQPKSAVAGAARKITWAGEIPPQKWMNFYTKVLSRFVGSKGLKLTLNVEVAPQEGVSSRKIEETKVALSELGLDSDIKTTE